MSRTVQDDEKAWQARRTMATVRRFVDDLHNGLVSPSGEIGDEDERLRNFAFDTDTVEAAVTLLRAAHRSAREAFDLDRLCLTCGQEVERL